jgi:hypothetical protein
MRLCLKRCRSVFWADLLVYERAKLRRAQPRNHVDDERVLFLARLMNYV